jgi:hypothetical protein
MIFIYYFIVDHGIYMYCLSFLHITRTYGPFVHKRTKYIVVIIIVLVTSDKENMKSNWLFSFKK